MSTVSKPRVVIPIKQINNTNLQFEDLERQLGFEPTPYNFLRLEDGILQEIPSGELDAFVDVEYHPPTPPPTVRTSYAKPAPGPALDPVGTRVAMARHGVVPGDSELEKGVATARRNNWKIAAVGLLPLAVWGGYQLLRLAQGYFAPHETPPPTEDLVLYAHSLDLPWGDRLECTGFTDPASIVREPSREIAPGVYELKGVHLPPDAQVHQLTPAQVREFDAVPGWQENQGARNGALDVLVQKILGTGHEHGCNVLPK